MVPSLVIKDIVGLNQPNFPLKDDSVLWRARWAISSDYCLWQWTLHESCQTPKVDIKSDTGYCLLDKLKNFFYRVVCIASGVRFMKWYLMKTQ